MIYLYITFVLLVLVGLTARYYYANSYRIYVGLKLKTRVFDRKRAITKCRELALRNRGYVITLKDSDGLCLSNFSV